MAWRRRGVPQVMAYWWKSPSRARCAASTSSRGGGKFGMPCARLMPLYWLFTRVISRMTDSVKPWTRFEIPIIAPPPSRQHHVALDGVHRDALLLEPGHALLQAVLGALQLQHHPAVVALDVGPANVGHEVEVLHEMVDDGLAHEVGREGQPHAHAALGPAHGYRPPAMAGTIETESPALSDVLAPSRKRMSSSLT